MDDFGQKEKERECAPKFSQRWSKGDTLVFRVSAEFAFEFPWTARDGELKDHNALLFSFIQNVHLFMEIDRDRWIAQHSKVARFGW